MYSQKKELAYHILQTFHANDETRKRISDMLQIFSSNMTKEEKMEAYKIACREDRRFNEIKNPFDIYIWGENEESWQSTL